MTEQEIIDMINEGWDIAITQIPGIELALINLALDSTPIPQAIYDARTAINVLRQAELDNVGNDERLSNNNSSTKK